jgi:serine/threonine protein kinase
VSKIIKKG